MTVGDDLCIGFFNQVWKSGLLSFVQAARVLEVGCGEVDWIADVKTQRPDLRIIGIDVRPVDRPKADAIVRGDVRTTTQPWTESFDCIVAISTLEHIGLGAYGDDKDPDGDAHAIAKMSTWLKPRGWLYFDVPYRPKAYEHLRTFRAYDLKALITRLIEPSGLILRGLRVYHADHPDSPYIACVL